MAQIIMLSWYVYKIPNEFCPFVWFIYLWVENEKLWKDTYIFERITFTLQIFRKSWKKMVCCQSFYKIYSEMAQRLRFPDQLVFRPRAKLEHMGPHSSVTHKLLWQRTPTPNRFNCVKATESLQTQISPMSYNIYSWCWYILIWDFLDV